MTRLASLLATVSVAAILAAGPSMGQEAGVVVEATGAYLMGNNSAGQARVDELGTVTDTSVSGLTGGYAALSIGKKVLPMWDITGRIAITELHAGSAEYTESGSFPVSDKLGTISSDLDFQTLDIEVGYSPEMNDDFDLRFFAGARGMHYTNSLADVSDKIGGGFLQSQTQEHEFYGAGPRAGLEFGTRFGDSPIGFSALAGGSVVFGTERQTETNTGGGFTTTTTTDVGKAIVGIEAQAAIDLHLGEQAKFSVGYRGEQLSGVNDFSNAGEQAEGQLVHGPFVKFKATF